MATNELKRTPLYSRHIEAGAKMVEFSGWEMPVQYESILKEHRWVRSHSGMFDVSHMGEFEITGKDVIPFLQHLMTNDLSLLEDTKSQYSNMCYENGTVVDDLIYYQENPEFFRMIVNAGNREKDFAWLNEHIGDYNVKIIDVSDKRARLAIQGPETPKIFEGLVDKDLSKLKRFYFTWCNFKTEDKEIPIFLAHTGYTGEDGYELSCKAEDIIAIWNTLLKIGVKPIGLGARDSLRLEACYSLYGHEISEEITPIEASIGWVVKEKPGIDYIGKEILLKQKKEGPKRKVVGVTLTTRGIIRANYKVFHEDEEIGFVTSGGFSPTLNKTIGLALIKKEYTKIDTPILIEIRSKKVPGVVTKTPFYRGV